MPTEEQIKQWEKLYELDERRREILLDHRGRVKGSTVENRRFDTTSFAVNRILKVNSRMAIQFLRDLPAPRDSVSAALYLVKPTNIVRDIWHGSNLKYDSTRVYDGTVVEVGEALPDNSLGKCPKNIQVGGSLAESQLLDKVDKLLDMSYILRAVQVGVEQVDPASFGIRDPLINYTCKRSRYNPSASLKANDLVQAWTLRDCETIEQRIEDFNGSVFHAPK